MSRETLKITYSGGQIKPNRDEKVKELSASLGFKWYAQGMNLEAGERDICFEKEVKGD